VSCLLCAERKTEITRILAGYAKDKKYYRKLVKILGITSLILAGELILTLTYGKEGITLGIQLIQKLFKIGL